MAYLKDKSILSLLLIIIISAYFVVSKDNSCSKQVAATESIEVKHVSFSEEDLEWFNKQLTNILLDSDFNGNVFVSRNGQSIFDRSFGFSDFRSFEPLSKETVFQLASITKTFTGAAILLLQEDSLLCIDEKVVEYIPEFPYNNITIKHLLTHTAGLQNYMFILERFWNKGHHPNNQDVLQMFIEQNRPLNFNPGSKFEYSNTAYVFLALIIESVSEMSYSEYLEERIFKPLGLEYTFVFDIDKHSEIENRAFGFRRARNSWRLVPADVIDAIKGDKGIFSNIIDLQKWDEAFYSETLLPKETIEKAFEFKVLDNDSIIEYGYGWRLQEVFGVKAVHHPGRWRGFRTSFKRFPEKNSTLIILSNNDSDIAHLVDTVQSLMFREERALWLEEQMKKLEAIAFDSIPIIPKTDSIP